MSHQVRCEVVHRRDTFETDQVRSALSMSQLMSDQIGEYIYHRNPSDTRNLARGGTSMKRVDYFVADCESVRL